MPSTAEAFGLMAIESMACGTPAIVFDGTALPETIGGPECGVIVPQGDAAALTKAIEDCLDNPDKLDRYRQNGLRHVASKHGFEDYAQRHLDLYQVLAKEQ
jgi:glycosyltransferase involved in cell wall biosynthesis